MVYRDPFQPIMKFSVLTRTYTEAWAPEWPPWTVFVQLTVSAMYEEVARSHRTSEVTARVKLRSWFSTCKF